MAMDALTTQALKSLLERVLPQLQDDLTDISDIPMAEREVSEKLVAALSEAMGLLQILHDWSTKAPGSVGVEDELGQDEEDALLVAASHDLDVGIGEEGQELSADDSVMLQQMEADKGALGDSLSAEAAQEDDADEMGDDEAARMLALMDGGEEAAAEEAVPQEALDPDAEMDDDEAARMLALMDAPAEPAAVAKAAKPGPKAQVPSKPAPKGAMADDEAQRLLAQMDASGEEDEADGDMSAEDEAAALLASIGGDDDEPEAEAPVVMTKAVKGAAKAAAHVDDELDEVIEEIGEWEPNDFQTDPDMVGDFNTNSEEVMETLNEQVLRLEQDPTNKEIIEEIFRAAHTLKGAAGMFGFKGLERVMHRNENLFDLIRKGKLTPSSSVVDAMFEGLDIIRDLLEACKKGRPCGIKTAPIVRKLTLIAQGKAVQSSRKSQAASAEGAADEDHGEAGANKGVSKDKKKEASTIRVDLNRLDALVNLVGELVIDRTRFVTIEEELRTNYPKVKLSGNISETVQLFGRHMNEIQDIIMKVRMVPIGNAFNKYPRIVRDLAKQLDKNIDLTISGETAEMDKTLVEQIGDPLIHLIRNSCDHGIELPEVRAKKGKNPKGNIYLSAFQEGNHIVINIEDDGKGLPVEILRKKGIEKGLISEEDKLTDRDIFNLIFEPGFSTAEKVTNVSGRGVGMDVVKKQIMKLKGLLEIESEQDRGTTITIRLPLTLAIVQSLLVRSKSEIFAIPLASVIESIRIAPEEIQKVGEAEVIKLRDRVLPLMHLDERLHLQNKQGSLVDFIQQNRDQESIDLNSRINKNEKFFVVVVGQPDRPFGILVHQLLNQQEMVIKSMGRLMRGIPCVAGGAVLGNGEVVLVLDIPKLEASFTTKARSIAA